MRRRWWAAAGVAAAVSGTLLVQGVVGGYGDSLADDGKPRPVRSTANTTPLRTTADGRSAALGKRDTEVFSMLGVTWADPSGKVAGPVEVRTRDAESGAWSGWLRLDGDSGEGEAGAARGGTEPAWVGPSDGVEVRVAGRESARLPKGLRLDMIDPGRGSVPDAEPAAYAVAETSEPAAEGVMEEADVPASPDTVGSASVTADPSVSSEAMSTAEPTGGTAPGASFSPSASASASASSSVSAEATVPPAPPSSAPRPPITSRAGWGADESISPEAPGYLPGGKIKAVVVHHTAESNDYTCEQAPAVIRGIYAYHVKQLGWKDIGYNFLVDKCGTVYEGRKGGVDRPVMGAHAYGFNAETTGISVLGTYTAVAPSTEAMTSVARVAAWKLGQYGVDPAGTATLTAGADGTNYFGKSWKKGTALSFPAVHGHRDGFNTQCPGDALYSRLPTIRTWAAGPVTGLTLKSLSGVSRSGSAYYTKAGVTVNWSATTPAPLISRYEVLVDGKAAVTAVGGATSARATLAAGTHKVAVRAVHQSGKTSTTPALTVIADTTAPTFTTKPNLALRTGTVNPAAVPLTLNWKAADAVLLKEVRLTAPVAVTYGPTVTAAHHTARSGVATTWSLTAHDQAGNTATAAVTGTPVILQETSATRTGTWTAQSSTSHLGGRSYTSTAKNASLTWTFTGRSAAWVVSRTATSGQAQIFVDGTKVTTVDLKSATATYRDAIWTKTWPSSVKHTVKIVVAGTSGRPTVTTDGLVHLK